MILLLVWIVGLHILRRPIFWISFIRRAMGRRAYVVAMFWGVDLKHHSSVLGQVLDMIVDILLPPFQLTFLLFIFIFFFFPTFSSMQGSY